MTRHPGYPGPPSQQPVQKKPPPQQPARRAKPQRQDLRLERRTGEFGAPRRYGIGTIMIVTLAMAVLLGIFNAFGVSPFLVAAVLVFLVLIGLGQMVFYQGVRPRAASLITGAVAFPLMVIIISVFQIMNGARPWFGNDIGVPIVLVLTGAFLGAGCGYLAGGMVAGIFLIMDAVERTLEKPIQAELVAEDLSPDNPPEPDQKLASSVTSSPQNAENPAPDSAGVHPLDR